MVQCYGCWKEEIVTLRADQCEVLMHLERRRDLLMASDRYETHTQTTRARLR